MKREPLLNPEHSESCKAAFENEIKENKDQIESRSAEVKRWDMVYAFLFNAQLHYAIYKYSAGDDIPGLLPLVQNTTENFIAYRIHPTAKNTLMKDSFFVYQECLSILSLNILIKSDAGLMAKLASAFDLLGKDMLIDRMLSYVLPARKVSNKLLWPKPFEQIYTVFDAGEGDRPMIISEYLADWYKGMRKAPWYNSHKNTENECAFYGYWSFESAAAVCLLNMDDTLFKDKLFYPKDFVDFNRNL